MEEIGGAVERVDDPAMGFVVALPAAAFLAEETVARPRLGELRVQNLFGAAVCRRDEIRRAFHRDLQVLDLAIVALETAAGLAGRGRHDVKQCGTKHGGFLSAAPCYPPLAGEGRVGAPVPTGSCDGREHLERHALKRQRSRRPQGERTADVHAGRRRVKAQAGAIAFRTAPRLRVPRLRRKQERLGAQSFPA